MADPQLGLRGAFPRHDSQALQRDGRLHVGCRGRGDGAAGRPSPKCGFGELPELVVGAGSRNDEGRAIRLKRPGVESRHVVQRQRAQRRGRPDREVPIRVFWIEEAKERPLGDRRRQIVELPQAVEPQLPDTVEIGLAETRLREDGRKQACALLGKPRQRRDGEERGIRPDVDIVIGTNPGEGLGDFDGIRLARPLVDHVGRDGGKPFLAGSIGSKPSSDREDEGGHRDGPVLDRADIEPVFQRVTGNPGKPEDRV